MRPHIEKVNLGEEQSLVIKRICIPYFDAPYHFHPEYELTYIRHGFGQRFVGDSVEEFQEGELVLLGPDLAHFWRSDAQFYAVEAKQYSEAIVLQFGNQLAKSVIGQIPEFSKIQSMLDKSGRGIYFYDLPEAVKQKLINLTHASEPLIPFLDLLLQLSGHPNTRALASEQALLRPSDSETNRMGRILDYTGQHFKEPITLAQIASIAHLSEASFCRYFRQRTHKTYFTYLIELRINSAKKSLIQSDLSVSQIALDVGFQNMSHFHRAFQKQTEYSPLQFRRAYQR